MTPRVAVVVADDHQVVREGLRTLLDAEDGMTVLGEAADGPSALELVERLRPDVLVLDLVMPHMGGLEVLRRLRARGDETRVVALTMHESQAYAAEALRAGATVFVTKAAPAEELIRGIRFAAAGLYYVGHPSSVEACGAAPEARDGTGVLTPREREVLRLTAGGATSVNVAATLHISPRTAEKHRANLMRKLGLSNRSELVRYAVAHGLIDARPIGRRGNAPS